MKLLKYVLYWDEELYSEKEDLQVFAGLCDELEDKNVRCVNLTEVCGDSLEGKLAMSQMDVKECLLITATDRGIAEANDVGMACVAYQNPHFAQEELFGVEFLVQSLDDLDCDFLEKIYQRKHQIPWCVMETKRCYLREITLEDLPALYHVYEGEGVTDFIEPLYAWEEEVEYMSAYIKNMYAYFGYGMWLVFDKSREACVGWAGLNCITVNDEDLLEMGYVIAKEEQRKGYAAEVCQAIVDFAVKSDTGYDTLYCYVHPKNEASIALLKKLHFTFEREDVRDGNKMNRYFVNLTDVCK